MYRLSKHAELFGNHPSFTQASEIFLSLLRGGSPSVCMYKDFPPRPPRLFGRCKASKSCMQICDLPAVLSPTISVTDPHGTPPRSTRSMASQPVGIRSFFPRTTWIARVPFPAGSMLAFPTSSPSPTSHATHDGVRAQRCLRVRRASSTWLLHTPRTRLSRPKLTRTMRLSGSNRMQQGRMRIPDSTGQRCQSICLFMRRVVYQLTCSLTTRKTEGRPK
mmetsp:Transcript_511/g.3692  ORF Transcript_511/g.3692 Transcript_511/m.3692 type:complete len:219 (-) Transcript_511:2484-3140(-)